MDDSCMMLILLADAFMMDYPLTVEDDHYVLYDQQGIFPKAASKFLTQDLVFLEKEHLKKCRYMPKDYQKKVIRLKSSQSRPSMTTLGSSSSVTNNNKDDVPDLLSFNMTWTQSDQGQILTFLTMIPSIFKLSDMFELAPGVKDKQYYFKGMI